MIFSEEKLSQIKKKIVIDMYFCYSLHADGISCMYNLFYDCGNGLQKVNLDKETYDFAMKVTKENYDKFSDVFGLFSNEYMAFEDERKDITSSIIRTSLIKKLDAFGTNIDVPLFIKLGEQYVFLNESKFIDCNENNDVIFNKYVELDALIVNEAHGREYMSSKKYKNDYKRLQKVARYFY